MGYLRMLDREVIESKLRFLREYLNDLKDYESISIRDYARVEPEIVIGILKKDTEDFKQFAQQIIRYMDM